MRQQNERCVVAVELKTILALDPAAARGVSNTGWAFGTYSDTEAFALLSSGVVEGGYDGFCDEVNVRRLLNAADVVVCEKYVPYKQADPSPMKIEGVVNFLRRDAVMQPASGKNTICPDTLLKALGLWSTTGHHHDEREAVRHALVYLIKSKNIPTLNLVRKATFG